MTIQVKSEQQILQEGLQILFSNMEPSKVARFWAACNVGKEVGIILISRMSFLHKNQWRVYTLRF